MPCGVCVNVTCVSWFFGGCMYSMGSKQKLEGTFGPYASLPQQDSIIIFMAGLHVFVYL